MCRWLLLAALVLAACTAPKSKVCRDTCTREADCHENGPSEDTTFDEGECIAACAALDRDPETQGLVTSHAACVTKAATCPEVLDCK